MSKSKILNMQEQLFYKSDLNINCTISEDATIITAENITDEVFTDLEFVSNTLEHEAAPMNIIDLEVYLTNKATGIRNEEPTLVPGLLELVKTQYTYSDTIAINSRKKTHKPFLNENGNGFKNGQTVSQVIDMISVWSRRMPDTSKYTKTYTLILDPPATQIPYNEQGLAEFKVAVGRIGFDPKFKGASSAVSRYNTEKTNYDNWLRSMGDRWKNNKADKDKKTQWEAKVASAKSVAEKAINETWVTKMHADMQPFKDIIDTIIDGLTHNVKYGATNWIQGLGAKEWFHTTFSV